MEMFEFAYENSKNPLCYNGDITNKEDYYRIIDKYPDVNAVMIGRGIISKPHIINEIISGNTIEENIKYKKLKEFHNCLFLGYKKEIQGDINVLYKMKEMWFYFSSNFDGRDKLIKRIMKSKNLREYEKLIQEIFECYE